MDKLQELFGDYLVKYSEQPVTAEDEGTPVHYTKHTIEEVLQKDNLRYIGVVFSAKYCPPCERL